VGRFQVRARLGAGAFGAVYRAYDPQLEREVALKVPHPGTLDTQARVERFLREARAAAQLRHPSIVPVHDAGQDGGHHYIASAFIPGETLAHALGDGPLDFSRGARVVRDLAEALAYAHAQGVVHRDVKPSNVMLDEQGRPHLMDFGLAHRQDSAGQLTRDGAVLGTPAYMAPEQAQGRRGAALPASDQYSLGVILYEALCGHTPFAGPVEVVLYNAMHTEPAPPRDARPDVPRDLETISLKAMAKRPEDRYARCQELADDLRRWLEGEPILARRLGLLERGVRWGRRYPGAAVAVVLAAAGLVLAAVLGTSFAAYQANQASRLREEQAKTQEHLAAANAERERAERERRKTEYQLCEQYFERGLYLLEGGDPNRGLLWLAEALQLAERAGAADLERVSRTNLANASRDLCTLETVVEHKNRVMGVAFRPDGKAFLTGSWDRTARVWDAATGEPITPPLDAGSVYGVAFSPDGKTVLTGSGQNQARLWDAATGAPLGPTLDHPKGVRAVTFRPDGRAVLTGCADLHHREWDLDTGRVIGQPVADGGSPWALAYSPDGGTVLVVPYENPVRLTDAATGQLRGQPLTQVGAISGAYAPDGKTVAVGNLDGTVRLWEVDTHKAAGKPFRLADGVYGVAYSPDSRRLLTGGLDRTARLWDLETGDQIGPPLQHVSGVWSVAYGPDGQTVLTGSDDGRARLWRLPPHPSRGPRQRHPGALRAVAVSPDGRTAVTAGVDRTAVFWAADGTRRQTLPHPARVDAVAFSPDGKAVLTGMGHHQPFWGKTEPFQGEARLWDAATGEPLGPAIRHQSDVVAVAFRPDGKAFVTGTSDGGARAWDTGTGEPLGPVIRPRGEIAGVAFAPDGRTIVTASGVEVQFWDAATGEARGESLAHPGDVLAVALSPDGKTVLAAVDDHTVRRWDVATRQPLAPPALQHPAPVDALAFSPDGRAVLTGGRDHTARLWDAATGRPLGPPFRHPAAVKAVAFGPGGATFVAGCQDGTAQTWAVSGPLDGGAEQLKVWVEVATGQHLGDGGVARVLDPVAWRQRRQRLQDLGGPPDRQR
jgi:WD40 repeat protein/tRNA A-37 threonylcarbamoyl transferase component Bud32